MIIGKESAAQQKTYNFPNGKTLIKLVQDSPQIGSTPIVRSEGFGDPAIKITDRAYVDGEVEIYAKVGTARIALDDSAGTGTFDIQNNLDLTTAFTANSFDNITSGIQCSNGCGNPIIGTCRGTTLRAINEADNAVNATYFVGAINEPSGISGCVYDLVGDTVIYVTVPTADLENIDEFTYFDVERLYN